MQKNIKKQKRDRRHVKIRARLSGTAKLPRLSVFRSNKFMYVQLIDDENAETLVSAKGEKKIDSAKNIGKTIAEKALAMKIKSVVFDRGGFGYKGRVKALAEAAREAGLKF